MTKLRILCLVTGLCLGGYALATAQQDVAADAAPGSDSPLLVEPKTPAEIFEAAVLTDKLARPDLAKRYLERLLEAQPADDVLLDLRDRHGPAIFLKLAGNEALRPASTTLLDRVNDAFRKRAADPKYIDAVLDGLQKSPQERNDAESALRSTGPIAVPRMLEHLAAPQGENEHAVLVQAMIHMGPQIIPPLLGALESPNDRVRAAAIEALGFLRSREVLPYLWHPAFAETELPGVKAAARDAIARLLGISIDKVAETTSYGAARELSTIATRHFCNEITWPQRDDGSIDFWRWNAALGSVAPQAVSAEEASLHVGLRLARQSLDLAPESKETQALVLAFHLASAGHRAGPEGNPPAGPGTVHDLALTAGTETVSSALAFAMQCKNVPAALGALDVLSDIGSAQLLTAGSPKRSPIAAALNYPDRRVQFAAADAVLKLDPETRFRGSERVVSILTRALDDSGVSKSVVVDPNSERASRIGGLVNQMGLEAEMAETGKVGFRIASEQMDIELVLLNVNVIRWPLSATVANLRADARTANIPIAIYGPESVKVDVESLIGRYSFITYIIEPATLDGLSVQLRPFLDGLKAQPLTPAQRAEQSAVAARWLAKIADSQRTSLYELRPAERALTRALADPRLSGDVLTALAAIPSVSAQELLQEQASSGRVDDATRELAAQRLTKHIRRFGLLLSTQRIAELEASLRNAADPRVATALAGVVGTFKPNAHRVGDRLQQFTPPAAAPAP